MDEKTLHIKSYSYLNFPKLGITGVHRTLSSAQAEHPPKRPVSGFSGSRSTIIHRTVWCALDMSGEPTEQRSTASNGRLRCQMNNECAQVRSQSCEVRTHRTVQCRKRTKDLNGQPLQTPTVCWRGRHRTVNIVMSVAPPDCPVCPSIQMTRIVVEAINTPKPPPFKPSKFSELHIQYKSKSLHSKTHSKDQILLKPQNQFNCLVTWERVFLCFFCCSCCLDCFLLPILNFLSAL
jgi:hypothetical protein